MWTILKFAIEFDTILSLSCVLVFWPRGMWDLHSLTGVEPTPRALEGEVLPTGLPFFMASSTASERPRASQRATSVHGRRLRTATGARRVKTSGPVSVPGLRGYLLH